MSIIEYLKGTQEELKKVSWPTQKQTIAYTIIVIAISFFVALYLGVFDFIFARALEKILFFINN